MTNNWMVALREIKASRPFGFTELLVSWNFLAQPQNNPSLLYRSTRAIEISSRDEKRAEVASGCLGRSRQRLNNRIRESKKKIDKVSFPVPNRNKIADCVFETFFLMLSQREKKSKDSHLLVVNIPDEDHLSWSRPVHKSIWKQRGISNRARSVRDSYEWKPPFSRNNSVIRRWWWFTSRRSGRKLPKIVFIFFFSQLDLAHALSVWFTDASLIDSRRDNYELWME